ncbi:MAG: DUF106 domain-containing protein [Nanoarchaeota archaeon]|nr:DUF106 domain-containing protein [Nanoarchaeota archaeon]MBU4242515.1 DUF106 domain-containing protein [Nanoarchaeota archaeon]MBU4352449.1 DUF106 domain-containing protein [Nanoarchaeota archaeon]
MFEGFFNTIFGPIMSLSEPVPIAIISFLLTLMTTLIYKYMTDQEVMKTLKADIKALQAQMKEHKDNKDKMMNFQKQAMTKNMDYMKKSFKPMIVTFIPIIFIFGWLRSHYEALGNPDVFFSLSWLWTYIIFSIIISIGLRKILKIS